MKSLENKAKVYADRIDDEYRYDPFSEVHLERMVDECKKAFVAGYQDAMRDVKMKKKRKRDGNQYAYRKGAAEAISNQWRNPKDELPKDGDTILIYYKYRESGRIEYKYSYMQVEYNAQNGFNLFENNMSKWGCKVLFWMPIPGLPNHK